MIKKIKQLIPWLMAIVIFGYLFYKYPISKVIEALHYANIWLFGIASLIYFFFIFFVDSFVTSHVFTRFSYPIHTLEFAKARGLTYLIMIVNYAASQAAFAYYLKRTHKVPIFEALSIFFFIAILDLYWIITLAFIGSFFQDYHVQGMSLAHFVQVVTVIAYAVLALKIFFWRRGFSKITGLHIQSRFVDWIRGKHIFHTFDKATLKDYVRIWLMRLPIHLTIIVFFYVVIQTFHCSIPFVQILCNVPIVFLIGCLPITPGGLGTTNVAMVALLSPHLKGTILTTGTLTAGELIFASTLLWLFFNYTLKVIVGTILLKITSKDLFKPTDTVPEEVAEEELGTLTPPSTMK